MSESAVPRDAPRTPNLSLPRGTVLDLRGQLSPVSERPKTSRCPLRNSVALSRLRVRFLVVLKVGPMKVAESAVMPTPNIPRGTELDMWGPKVQVSLKATREEILLGKKTGYAW